MPRYEYTVTKHPTEELLTLTYFCNEEGICTLNDVTTDSVQTLENLLNEKGKEGWEAVHLAFGKGGMIAVWKRAVVVSEQENG